MTVPTTTRVEAGLGLAQVAGDEEKDVVALQDAAPGVGEDHPVGVAVEGDAQVGPFSP